MTTAPSAAPEPNPPLDALLLTEPIVPRGDLVRGLIESDTPITLLAGDSGVGKTTILGMAKAAAEGDWIVPDAIQVRWAPGSLQRALLESLAVAAAQTVTDESTAERLGNVVLQAARNVVQMELRDLAGAVGRQLLGFIRTHVSPEAADALAHAGKALATSYTDALLARITNASDGDVVDLIAGFAGEVRQAAGDRTLILTLDSLERLVDEDLRRLSDLGSTLPKGVRIWAGFAVPDAATRSTIRSLAATGVRPIEVVGLSQEQVGVYLTQYGIHAGMAPLVYRITQGYPLYVHDAAALIRNGGATADTLAGLKLSDVLAQRTDQAWHALIPASRRAALLLAAFPEALPPEIIAEYLDVDPAAWAVIKDDLREAAIFTGVGRVWFHEVRRRHIWETVLSEEDRAVAAEKAQDHLTRAMARVLPDADDLMQYLALAPFNPLALAASNVQLVLNASRDELAIAAAVLDLVEPRSVPAVSAEACLLHARDAYVAVGDLQAAMRRLVEQGLLVVASNRSASVVAPTWGSEEAIRLLEARASQSFGRTPLRGAATQLFESALVPLIGPFRVAMYGAGWMTALELSKQALVFQRQPDEQGIVYPDRGEPSLLIRARHGGMPLSAVVAFNSAENQEAARASLWDLDREVLGAQLRIVDLVRHPATVIPSRRFHNAVERILDRHTMPGTRTRLEAAISVLEDSERRVGFVSEVRDLCTPTEGFVYGLDEPLGILYYELSDGNSTARVIGWTGTQLAEALSRPEAPFARFDIVREARLPEGTRIGSITYRSAQPRDDPILDESNMLYARARDYNTGQTRVQIPLDAVALAPLLAAAAERHWADARALYGSVARGHEVPALTGETSLVLVESHPRGSERTLAQMTMAMAISTPNNSGRDVFAIRFVDELPQYDPTNRRMLLGTLQDEFFPGLDVRKWTQGLASTLLAHLLDFDEGEVRLFADAMPTAVV